LAKCTFFLAEDGVAIVRCSCRNSAISARRLDIAAIIVVAKSGGKLVAGGLEPAVLLFVGAVVVALV
jgi:hypothetical protein